MQLYRLIYCSKSALHVSGEVFAHHQEHLTVFTVSGSVHPRANGWTGMEQSVITVKICRSVWCYAVE